MKRFLTLFATAMLVIQAWGAVGDYIQVDNLKYKVLTEATSSTKGTLSCYGLSDTGKAASSLSLSIPYLVSYNSMYYFVQDVVGSAFVNSTNIKSVFLKYGIKSIGAGAFNGCSELTSAYLPSSAKTIGATAFYNCSKLANVYYAITGTDGLSIGSSAFPANSSMKLNCPNGTDMTTIQAYTALSSYFSSFNTSLNSYDVSLSSGARLIVTNESSATARDCAIVGYNVGSTAGVFKPSGMFSLTNYGITFTVKSIAPKAFYQNTNLKEANFVNLLYLEDIGSEAFYKCTELTTATLSSGNIGNHAFNGCSALSSVTLNEGVKSIGVASFSNCTSLPSINIPASITTISPSAFVHDDALTAITVASGNTNYASYDNALYTKAYSEIIVCPGGKTSVQLNANLKRVTSSYAFGWSKLTSIEFPYGMEFIYNNAFNYCTQLAKVYFPSTVTTIGSKVFTGCTALSEVYMNIATPLTYNNCFDTHTQNINLYVPCNTSTTYKATSWNSQQPIYILEPTSEKFPYDEKIASSQGTAYYNYNATAYTDGTTNYNGEATLIHYDATSSSVAVPKSVTANGKTFAVTKIGNAKNHVFSSTVDFSVTGCLSVTNVQDYAFEECSHITSISLPSVKTIGAFAFYNCSKLTTCKWGSKLSTISNYAFMNSGLSQDIILPYGFRDCSNDKPFSGVPSKRILIPSSAGQYFCRLLYGMSSLEEAVINCDDSYSESSYLTKIPATCIIRVPVEKLSSYKSNSAWSSRSNYITAGAYDFTNTTLANEKTSICHVTVTDNNPITYNGVTYDGKVKYVYHPNIASATSFTPQNDITNSIFDKAGKYLVEAIGDSCFAAARGISSLDFSDCSYLTTVGSYVCIGSNVTTVTLPNSVTTIKKHAFSSATSLKDLTIMGNPKYTTRDHLSNFNGEFYGQNATGFTCYVSQNRYKYLYNYVMANCGMAQAKMIVPYVVSATAQTTLSANTKIEFAASDKVKAYIITGANEQTYDLTTQRVNYVPESTGLFIDGLAPNTMYKPVRTTTATADNVDGNMLVAVIDPAEIKLTNYMQWNQDEKKFMSQSSASVLNCSAILNKDSDHAWYVDLYPNPNPPAPTYETGDVNGDGVIDVADINVLLNIILGNDSASNYGGRADVNGDGNVDVTDINAVLNIMLGM